MPMLTLLGTSAASLPEQLWMLCRQPAGKERCCSEHSGETRLRCYLLHLSRAVILVSDNSHCLLVYGPL